uniref:NAC domain-containing protein n=1 Tax=Leersia perrieri TaxID=77586 RepID=A0A0D9X859_9ORYZ
MEEEKEKQQRLSSLPAGFRFFPTDEELVTYYLARKAMDATFTSAAIRDVDLYSSDPWHLPCDWSAASTGGEDGGGGDECYFFCTRSSKYPSGGRARRSTAGGYWKSTGKDKAVYGGGGVVIGTKKTLVFYGGRAPRGEKTRWSEWVICRVFMKKPPSDNYTMLEMEQEEETTTAPLEHTQNQSHLLPPPPPAKSSSPPWQTSSRSGEEDGDGMARRREESPVVSSRCASPSYWPLNIGSSSTDDLPELTDFGEIYSGMITGGGTNSVCSLFPDEPYCWNF